MRTLCFLFLTLTATTGFAVEYDLAITNVSVVDAVHGTRLNQAVYVTDNTIQLVTDSPAKAQAKTATATVEIDGTGKFLMPGLWDMHVHIVYEPELVGRMPELFLDYGITSVRDTGALLHKIQPEVKRWAALGDYAPDLFFSGPLQDGALVVYDGNDRPAIGIANPSQSQAQANVASLVAAGADFIKIYELVSEDVFAELVEAANEHALPIAAHVPLALRAEEAGPQVNSMEHLRNVEIACAENADELYQARRTELAAPGAKGGHELRSYLHNVQRPLALQSADVNSEHCRRVIRSLTHTIQVPTLRLNTITQFSPIAREDWVQHLDRLPSGIAKQWLATAKMFQGQPSPLGAQMSAWSLALTRAMLEEGVPIGAGTDTPIAQAIPGYSLHTELERLVDAGLSPQQALAAATVVPAQFFGLEQRKGVIDEGMEADLLLLNGNPLEDIRNSRSIEMVISNGQRVR